MADFHIRPLREDEADRLEQFWRKHWGAPVMVTRGQVHHARNLQAFVAEDDAGEWVGLLTYHVEHGVCEVISLDSMREGQGIGSALLDAIVKQSRDEQYQRLWLITTNDNTHALRFYQKRGWRLVGLYPDSIVEARRIKLEIPERGFDDIRIRDELELEYYGED